MTVRTYQLLNNGIQPHLFSQIKEAIGECAWLVPVWLEEIRVNFDGDDEGTLRISVEEAYRTAYLYVCNGWAKVPDEERPRYVLHELLHVHTWQVFDLFHDLLSATTKDDEPLNKWASDQMRRAIERCTNDLERAIWNRNGEAA